LIPTSTIEGWFATGFVTTPTPLLPTTSPFDIFGSGTVGGANNLWDNGDIWQVQFPANQLRVGYQYEIYGASGFQVETSADAAYASLNALLDFNIDLSYPFDLDPTPGRATLIHMDWDGDNAVDNVYAVGNTTRTDGSVNSFDVERVKVSHSFVLADLAPRNAIPTYLTQAQFRVESWERGTTASRTLPSGSNWYQLPQVVINGDDYDTDLRTLNLSKWENNEYHTVMLETQYGQYTFQNIGGVNVPVNRQFYATDTLLIPPGSQNVADTLTAWVSYSKPFIFSNGLGVTSMRHQAVHGSGGALNWMSDVNADTKSFSQRQNESPLGNNPVNFHEFIVPNGNNLMNVQGANIIAGASFPRVVPGVGRASGGSFVFYQGDRGIYNGFGFTADNLPTGQRAFSFDSQALFLGDRVSGNDNETRPLAADIFLNPLVGTNSQIMQLTGFVTGSTNNAASYRYVWELEKIGESSNAAAVPSGVGMVGMGGVYGAVALNNASSGAINPLLSPLSDVMDEPWFLPGGDGSGRYRVYLRAFDSAGAVAFSAYREFDIEPVPLRAFIMADPPSGSVGSEIEFHVFIDGGASPYRVELDTDNDGAYDITREIHSGNQVALSHVYSQPSVTAIPPNQGSYTARVHVTDSQGAQFAGSIADATTEVYIADTIPLNASLLVQPPSGVAPFLIDVHYAVSGGSPMSGDEYNVTAQLVNTDGGAEGAVSRDESSSFGVDGQLDDPRQPGGDDDPVRFIVPAAGNYYVQLIVTDNDGNVIQKTEDVFAAGYVGPTQYGTDVPRVVRDGNNRPMHAFRVWTDPFLNVGNGTTTEWDNELQNTFGGGRLMEGDLQVIGDLITTDPSPSFRSPGLNATSDPADQTKFLYAYQDNPTGEDLILDFYDTFTLGRVNLNTASEDVLTALFMRIVKTRAYYAHSDTYDVNSDGDTDDVGESFRWYDIDNDGTTDIAVGLNDLDGDFDFLDERMRNVRNYAGDLRLTETEARALARAVVKYRTAFYDAHKPNTPGATSDFGYRQGNVPAAAAVQSEVGSTLRVDHVPVIGPWDGVNPHEYAYDDRDAALQAPDSADLTNAWDNMAANYYNLARGLNGDYTFYAPSDIAVVRQPYDINVTIDVDGDGVDPEDFRFEQKEPAGNYAKYLNDVVTNGQWDDSGGRPDGNGVWSSSGLYQYGGSNYSQWGFDARNYFSYFGGAYDVVVRLPSGGGTPTITVNQTAAAGTPADARNQIGVFESNGETAYGFIPNPPFRSVMDLYKVIDADTWTTLFGNGVPNTFQLDSGQMELTTDHISLTNSVFSGPSVFMYSCYWDEDAAEFVARRNFIDDIAPFVTCRSYVYRVDASGGVVTNSTQGADEESSRINRDRTRTAIIDVGKLSAGRPTEDGTTQGWQILYQKTSKD
jgi:hypothetical protein